MISYQLKIASLLIEALYHVKLPFYAVASDDGKLNAFPTLILGDAIHPYADHALAQLKENNITPLLLIIKEMTIALKFFDERTQDFINQSEEYCLVREAPEFLASRPLTPNALIDFRTINISHLKKINYKITNYLMQTKEIRADVMKLIADLLSNQLLLLLQKKNGNALKVEDILLPMLINEKLLPLLIETLEKEDTSLSSLSCAILLLGELECMTFPYENFQKIEYKEKRLQDAVKCFIKASKNSFVRPLAEFYLWELKQQDISESLTTRMKQLDVTPFDLFTNNSYEWAKKDRTPVIMPLYNDHGFFSRSSTSNTNKLEESDKSLSVSIINKK